MGKKIFKYDKRLCKKFGQKIASIRHNKNLKQDEVAFAAGLSTSYLSAIELGKSDITISSVKRIAKALDIEIYELFIYK